MRGAKCCVLVLCLLPVPALSTFNIQEGRSLPGPNTHPAAPAAQAIVDAALAAGAAPGISAAILTPDRQFIILTAGVSDRATKAPITPLDRMLIGSVGKTFVAARAVQLIEQGDLALDAPIATYLGKEPWFARLPNGAATTVRHLMTHTSGLVRYEFKDAFTRDLRANPDRVWKPEELVAYVLGDTPPFAPGAGWEYSDTNYIVLGMIIERVHSAPLFRQVHSGILRRMAGASFVPAVSREVDDLIQGYTGPGDPVTAGEGPVIVDNRLVVNPQFEWAGGGYASTPTDLVIWAKKLYEGGVFRKPESVKLMIDAAVPARLGPDTKYGLGVIVRTATPVGEVWGHSGFFPGYLTEMIYLPASGIAVSVQVNSSHARALGFSPLRLAYQLADVVRKP